MRPIPGLILFAACAFHCAAITFNCSTLNVPGTPTGINNSGLIVGTSGGSHGYLRDTSGNVTTIDYPGGGPTRLFTINNNGTSVGVSSDSSGSVYFTRDLAGNFHTFTLPAPYNSGSLFAPIYGINDAGAISGFNGTFFILNPDGTAVSIPAASGTSLAGSINNASQMMETAPPGSNGGASAIGAPGASTVPIRWNDPSASAVTAFGLNNPGSVVGFVGHYLKAPPFGPPWTGFVRDPSGVFSSLVCQGWSNIQPYAVNDNGIVTGVYTVSSTTGYFIATPLPGSAQYNASVTSVDFGEVPALQVSAPMTFTISNSGNTRMDIGGIRLKGEPSLITSPSFAASACMNQGAPVASLGPGASCVVSVTVVPSNPFPAPVGTHLTDVVLIDDSAPNSPHMIPVSATLVTAIPQPPPPQPPVCTTSGLISGPPRQINFTIQDSSVGLQSITVVSSTNATAQIPSFSSGTTAPVTVPMTESDLQHLSSLTLQATSVAGLQTSCSADIAGGANQWIGLGATIIGKPAIILDWNGQLEAFARGSDRSLLHSMQNSDGETWSAWGSLGGVIVSDPAVTVNPAGGLEVFAIGTDQALWHIWQSAPGEGWSSWSSLGGVLTAAPSVVSIFDTMEVFTSGPDHAVWHNRYGSDGNWSGWSSIGGYILSGPVAATNGEQIEVFARGGDQSLWQIVNSSPMSPAWSDWRPVGGGEFIGIPAVAVNADGAFELFLKRPDQSVWHNAEPEAGSQRWNGWDSLGGYLESNPAANLNADGRLEVFGRGGDNALWHKTQLSPGGSWGEWGSFGGVLADGLATAASQDGRLGVYGRAPDSTLWGIAQVFPGAWN